MTRLLMQHGADARKGIHPHRDATNALGADPVESDAEPWATPRAWAQKAGHVEVLQILLSHRPK
jgi:hypothetical protein